MADSVNIRELNDLIASKRNFIDAITQGMDQTIVGQKHLVDSLLIALLANGHILLEGVPGLAKTLAIKTLASIIDAKYSRIQFTPDLLPADVVGTMVYSVQKEKFEVKQGPVFANFVLADEINRAPAKVQSALLEAMQERQVTIGDRTFKLDDPFLVMATQNPIEQEGTYPLPEAQVDRFLMKVVIGYPNKEEEKQIIRMNIAPTKQNVQPSHHSTRHCGSARHREQNLHRRENRTLHRRYRVCHPLPFRLRIKRVEEHHFIWCLTSCKHQHGTRCTRLRIPAWPWLCDS